MKAEVKLSRQSQLIGATLILAASPLQASYKKSRKMFLKITRKLVQNKQGYEPKTG